MRMVDFFGADLLFSTEAESKKASKNAMFYQTKLASAILDGSEVVAKGRGKSFAPQDVAKWKSLSRHASELLRIASPVSFGSTPFLEREIRQPRVTSDDFVEYETVKISS
jgi:hypothetical protein